MSDVQSRSSARGRPSARGGRGGYSNRGGRGGNSRSNADNTESSDIPSFDEGEIGQMKQKYSDTLPLLRELFPDWKDEDLVFALEDSNGQLEEAIERITEGNVSQWGEVKKKTTDRSRPKPKEVQSTAAESNAAPVRGARGRGGFEGRGRARGDRGRGGRGGRAGAHTNGTRVVSAAESVPAATAAAVAATPAEAVTSTVGEDAASEPAAVQVETKSNVIPEGTKTGWASLFNTPAPAPQKKPPQPAAPAPAPVSAPVPAPEQPVEPVPEQQAPEPVPVPAAVQKTPVAKPTEPVVPAIPTTAVKPPQVDLTETNLEQIPDVSAPAPTATAASTVGSALDPIAAANATPSRAPPASLPGSAYKQGVRAPGFQRRVMEQQQAVVMPGNHAVDRAAVQFGSMGLNGDAVDIDENREEAETRAQPPQHSPVAPRASLPPSTQASETTAARPAPASVADSSFSDFGRYSETQKPYDPFNPQASQPQPIQEPFANQAPTQPAATTGSEYSPFYAADQRFPYYNNYGTYGQTQDVAAAPRAAPGFGVSGAEATPQVPTTQAPQPLRGHNTPNPTVPGATQTPAAAQHMPGQNAYAYGYNPYYSNPHYAQYMNQMNQQQYGRSRPMYDDARRYDEQQQQQHYGMPHNNQYGYGSQYGPYAGKGGMYGQPHGGFNYDHTASPANAAASFNQATPGRDSVYSGRTGSAQPADNQQTATGANAFGATGMSDVFGRSQAGGFGQNPSVAQQAPVTTEETKGFEAPKAGGPSPSLAQANRPGSATNNAPGQAQTQTGLPPLQGQQGQQGFGGYGHLNPQYGGLGGLSGHQAGASQQQQQQQQTGGYNNYGAGFGNYYGNNRGGWGNNYGH
ncbi:uncharacterized protein N7483_001473 [Penicillium malachiteum]|uniref:uncharacterized protein n=1 Tax=Penicillium malachiteum TaxID=1324776 RepID=UPI0025484D80|nr:uncharacterized protein N7483_001473 [Penicillium malachiteum]KAJ5736348.1 hypothetical protein N7483_001473 [Penicillium malachiteum]